MQHRDPNADSAYGMSSMFYKESKKRHRSRPNAAAAGDENLYPAAATVTNRFIKSATAPHRMLNGSSTVQKHKLFFGRQRSVPAKDSGVTLHPMMSMTLSRSNLYSGYGGNGNGGGSGKHSSHHHLHHSNHHHPAASFFHMRYKSLTNLHNPSGGGEYDTLESSNSGGKTSGGGDSGGSRDET